MAETNTLPRWMSQKDVAAYISADVRTVRRYTADRKLTAHKLGGLVRYDRHEIDALMQSGVSDEGESA